MTDTDRDLTLLGLAERVKRFTGHIEDMSDDERVYLLGAFAGTAGRLREHVEGLYADSATTNTRALPALRQVMLALGADENWAEEESR